MEDENQDRLSSYCKDGRLSQTLREVIDIDYKIDGLNSAMVDRL